MDNKVIVGIHQPNFMPWLGYFYKIFKSDVFIFLDDVQIQKKGASYTNRVSISMNGKSTYLTVPIKRNSMQLINEVEFQNNLWKKKVITTLQSAYGKAKFFKQNRDFIFSLIEYDTDNLAEFNMNFILEVCKKLDITSKIYKSSEFNVTTTSTQRLIDLIKKVDGNVYLSGSGGDNYQDHELYKKSNIALIYNKMPVFEYQQLKTEQFIPGLSIVDAIFNIGFDYLKQEFFKL